MVRAILEGRKTQTRRVMNPQPQLNGNEWIWRKYKWLADKPRPIDSITGGSLQPCPFGEKGDRLWVRETHAEVFEADIPAGRPTGPIGTLGSPARPDWKSRYVYLADGAMPNVQWHHVGDSQPVRWSPSIHMPRRASRIRLEITGVRVERLNDCTEDDARVEGGEAIGITFRHDVDGKPRLIDSSGGPYRDGFRILWESINGPGAWDANPWVWVVEFRRIG